MIEFEAASVQRDGRPASGRGCEGEPSAVEPVSDDRAASTGQLCPQLMPAARGRCEFNERHLAKSFHHPGPDMALPAGDLLVGFVVGPFCEKSTFSRGGPQLRSALFALAFDPIVPVNPLPESRRKPPLDNGFVGFFNRSLPKLSG